MNSWENLITAWEQHQLAVAVPATTIKLRMYWVARVGRDFAPGPAAVTFEGLIAWLAAGTWGPETRRSIRASLRSFWDWLMVTGRASESPAHQLPRVKVPRARPRPAPEADFKFALSIADRRTRLAIMLAGYCGLRRGEIARLRREDMEPDLLGQALRVVGKGGHVRMVPLPPEIVVEIERIESGWLFPSTRSYEAGRHISPAWLSKLVKRNLPRELTTHTLRHRCGTVAYAKTKDLRAVQELLGHARPETTARYTLIPDADVRAAMQAAVA